MDNRSWARDLAGDTSSSVLASPLNSTTGSTDQQTTLEIMNSLSSTNSALSSELKDKAEEIKSLKLSLKNSEEEVKKLKIQLDEYEKEKSKHSKKSTNIKLDISRALKNIYSQLEASENFNTAAPYLSAENSSTKLHLHELLKEALPDTADEELLRAIHARYTHERKSAHECAEQKKARRITSRRTALYAKRLRHADKESASKEKEMLQKMTPADMSDYESDDDGNLIVKRPRWRKAEETRALMALDKNYPTQRPLVMGTPSKRRQPLAGKNC